MRFDWGVAAARSVGLGATVSVVVDVLSFTTTVSVALDAGTIVLPWPYAQSGAAAFAAERDAALAVGRAGAGPGQFSLSPAALRLGAPPARLVLPSPNGATIAHVLGDTCIAGSLRNEGWGDLSPEAETAAAVWDSVAPDVSATLFNCASGRELAAAGYRDDVLIAGEVDTSTSVPLLRNGSFEPAD